MGGAIEESSRNVYRGLFERWSCRRYALGKTPYFPSATGSEETNKNAAIAYVALNLGPLERDVGTVQNHLQAIGYFHKVRDGYNPLTGMVRLKNLMRDARKGRANAKCRRLRRT